MFKGVPGAEGQPGAIGEPGLKVNKILTFCAMHDTPSEHLSFGTRPHSNKWKAVSFSTNHKPKTLNLDLQVQYQSSVLGRDYGYFHSSSRGYLLSRSWQMDICKERCLKFECKSLFWPPDFSVLCLVFLIGWCWAARSWRRAGTGGSESKWL